MAQARLPLFLGLMALMILPAYSVGVSVGRQRARLAPRAAPDELVSLSDRIHHYNDLAGCQGQLERVRREAPSQDPLEAEALSRAWQALDAARARARQEIYKDPALDAYRPIRFGPHRTGVYYIPRR